MLKHSEFYQGNDLYYKIRATTLCLFVLELSRWVTNYPASNWFKNKNEIIYSFAWRHLNATQHLYVTSLETKVSLFINLKGIFYINHLFYFIEVPRFLSLKVRTYIVRNIITYLFCILRFFTSNWHILPQIHARNILLSNFKKYLCVSTHRTN